MVFKNFEELSFLFKVFLYSSLESYFFNSFYSLSPESIFPNALCCLTICPVVFFGFVCSIFYLFNSTLILVFCLGFSETFLCRCTTSNFLSPSVLFELASEWTVSLFSVASVYEFLNISLFNDLLPFLLLFNPSAGLFFDSWPPNNSSSGFLCEFFTLELW